jgi:hypothetical protein
MKYYKDSNNQVFAYESDGSQDSYIHGSLIPINEADALAITSPAPTPAQMIAAAIARINSSYDAAIAMMTAGYPAGEISSWGKQEAEARAWTSNNVVPTPWLDAAVMSRGITKADLASRIVSNANVFISNSGSLTGKRQRLCDEINALGINPTSTQLNAIQW